MPIGPNESLDLHSQALILRARRQEILAANIANADTPNFKARDIDFSQALTQALSKSTHARTPNGKSDGLNDRLLYRLPEQASGDGNTVDMDRERANFADNAVRYEATLRFINGKIRGMLSAIRGD